MRTQTVTRTQAHSWVPGIVATLVSVLATAVPGWAWADGIAGSSCVLAEGPTEGAIALGIVQNLSDGPRTVLCEADPPDKVGTVNATSRVIGSQVSLLTVIDSHPTADVVCGLTAIGLDGASRSSATVRSRGTGAQDIADPEVLRIIDVSNSLRVSLSCTVPGVNGNGEPSGVIRLFAEEISSPLAGVVAGPPGPKGDRGSRGSQGRAGARGADGAPGASGDRGPTGAPGQPGRQGITPRSTTSFAMCEDFAGQFDSCWCARTLSRTISPTGCQAQAAAGSCSARGAAGFPGLCCVCAP